MMRSHRLQLSWLCAAFVVACGDGATEDVSSSAAASTAADEFDDANPLADQLIAYYAMDEVGGDVVADSKGTADGTTTNSPAIVIGKKGNARDFAGGVADRVRAAIPTPTLPLTIAFWVKSDSSSPVGMFDSAANQMHVLRNYSAGAVEWWANNPQVSLGMTAGVWTHLAFVYDFDTGVRRLTYYRDGALVSQLTGSSDSTFAWTNFDIGTINNGVHGTFDGSIDELGVWDRALTVTEVTELATGNGGTGLFYRPGGASACGETLDQQNDGTTVLNSAFDGLAQTFTPEVSGQLTTLELFMGGPSTTFCPSGNVTLEVQDLGGTVLASEDRPCPGAYGWVTWTFSSPATVDAGTQYRLYNRANAGNVAIISQTGEQYPGGSSNAGPYDWRFKAYVTPDCTEPSEPVASVAGWNNPNAHLGFHGCAVKSDGTVWCWGYNAFGQLGDGSTIQRNTPVQVSGIAEATSVASGYGSSCAPLSDGTAVCWGRNSYGQLGDGTTTNRTTPVAVSGLSGVVEIRRGLYHTCALIDDGTVKCWGDNGHAQLGDGTTATRTSPVAVSGIANAVGLSLGFYHSCALLDDGAAYCWGRNSEGQLGDGTVIQRPAPVAVSGLAGASQIAVGGYHTCALRGDSTGVCWGYNAWGQLGDGTTATRTTPVAASGLAGVSQLALGYYHSCATLSDGSAQCWGMNNYGQLGDGTVTTRYTPAPVTGLTDVTSVSGGLYHTTAGRADGTAMAWGYNALGQLGDGTTTTRTTPVPVSGLADLMPPPVSSCTERQTLASNGYHSCAVAEDSTVKCWGYNYYGQVGDGTTTARTTPATVAGLSNATVVGGGIHHSCAATSDGTASCWGYNYDGQLGDGSTTTRHTPVAVTGLSGVTGLSKGGYYHTCALVDDGTVQCWGRNSYGQLGDGTWTTRSSAAPVTGITDAVAIVGGVYHSCALLGDGTVTCWGYNYHGQLGTGDTVNRNTPTAVPGLAGVTALAGGGYHTCALLSDGTASCWGYNALGQLGDNTTTTRSTPAPVQGLSGVNNVSAGLHHSCAVLEDGTGSCWGYNTYGQLGDGTTGNRLTPTPIAGLSDTVWLTGGSYFTCARRGDGSAICWGYNYHGQVGDGTTALRTSPTNPATGLTTAAACDAPAVCGNGVIDGAEECDGGACCDSDCTYTEPGTVCDPSVANECDLPDTCDGISASCANAVVAVATPCGPTETASDCFVQDTCNGDTNAPACVDNGVHAAGAKTCRSGSHAECDPAEQCDGVSAACPVDAYAAAGSPCGSATPDTECDGADTCEGFPGKTCLANIQPAGTSCGDGPAPCSDQDTCDGTGSCLPNHRPQFAFCDDGDGCTHTDRCDDSGSCQGTTKVCPGDTACIDYALACDGTPFCSGTPINEGGACMPPDVSGTCFASFVCVQGVCDLPE